jgi:hypothetical protein
MLFNCPGPARSVQAGFRPEAAIKNFSGFSQITQCLTSLAKANVQNKSLSRPEGRGYSFVINFLKPAIQSYWHSPHHDKPLSLLFQNLFPPHQVSA